MAIERYDCFVTPIWKIAHDPRIDLAALEAAVENQRRQDQSGNRISNVGGWQSQMYLFDATEFQPLRDFVIEQAIVCCRDWGMDFLGHAPVLNTMWANVNLPGHVNLMHHHWGLQLTNFNVLSGAYYVRCNEHSGSIRFLDERPSAKFVGVDTFMPTPNRFIGDRFTVHPMPGDLLLFPSWLEHEVTAGTDDQPRISISFNISVPRELSDRIYHSNK